MNLMLIAIPLLILGVIYTTAGILAHTKRFGGDFAEQDVCDVEQESRGARDNFPIAIIMVIVFICIIGLICAFPNK